MRIVRHHVNLRILHVLSTLKPNIKVVTEGDTNYRTLNPDY